MKTLNIQPLSKPFDITINNIASDKSISHRAAIFSLLSDQPTHIQNYLIAEDTLNTLHIVEQLGATITKNGSKITIVPPQIITEPTDVLNCGNSGTAMRLFCGLLSSIKGHFVLTGDTYLNQRPMSRITTPLKNNGASILGADNGNKAPISIEGSPIKSFSYQSKINSAQIKSAMILSALVSKGTSKYKENELTRDHTERMLKAMGADIATDKNGYITIKSLTSALKPLNIKIPGDPSSAFFFAVAAAIIKDSQVTIKNVSLNPTRIEAYKILQKMGVSVSFIELENSYEPIGDIIVKHKELLAVEIDENISWLIDELPALAIAMSNAKGTSIVKNGAELRVKESDRIKSVVDNLALCGIKYKEFEDGYEIIGSKLSYAKINSYGDHRIAMSFAIGGLMCGMQINDIDCIDTSFPNFEEILRKLQS